jgi:hypothetical protein
MYLVVIQSLASATYGLRLRWHKLDRTGVLDSAPPPDDIALQPRSANIS